MAYPLGGEGSGGVGMHPVFIFVILVFLINAALFFRTAVIQKGNNPFRRAEYVLMGVKGLALVAMFIWPGQALLFALLAFSSIIASVVVGRIARSNEEKSPGV